MFSAWRLDKACSIFMYTSIYIYLYFLIQTSESFYVKTYFLNDVFNCRISLDSRKLRITFGRGSDTLPDCLYTYTITFHLSGEIFINIEGKKRGALEGIIVLHSSTAYNLSRLCSYTPRTTGYRFILILS